MIHFSHNQNSVFASVNENDLHFDIKISIRSIDFNNNIQRFNRLFSFTQPNTKLCYLSADAYQTISLAKKETK
jgi:hypothetical protein